MKQNTKKTFSFQSPHVETGSIEELSRKLLQTTEELSRKNDALAASERKRKEMLANISHDLRAPITAIRSALDLLSTQENLSQEVVAETVNLIDRRVGTLENLIQDMYYLFVIEDDTRPFDYETLELVPFLESYFYDAIVDSRYDDHEMVLDVEETLSCNLRIDVQKTIRVLDNLFTNAAKYSGTGSVITLSASTSSEDYVMIKVSDNGVGISAAALPHIFERTYTISSARTPGTQTGSGLGLSIVKAIIEKEGGSITCESEEGKGCTFTILLPLCK